MQHRDGGAERRDLRERQVDEDDAALDDVHAEIGVDPGQDEAGGERRRQELGDLPDGQISHHRPLPSP